MNMNVSLRFGSFLWLIWVALTVASDDIDISKVYFEDIQYGGSGCPAGSVATAFATDRKSFTLLFDSYVASVGPRVAVTEERKNCQLNVKLHVPGGWQYSIVSLDYRGYVSLDRRIEATQKVVYYFSGETRQTESKATFLGPITQDYLFHDALLHQTSIYSPCGEQRNLNINSQIRIDNSKNRSGQGLMTTDAIDGNYKQIYHLIWRKCNNDEFN